MSTSEAAAEPASPGGYVLYDDLKARGQLYQKWMDGPDTAETGICRFQPTTANISFKMVNKNELGDAAESMGHEEELLDQLRQPMSDFRKESFEHHVDGEVAFWQGLIGEGILVLESVYHQCGPFMSEVSQRAYEKYYDISTLKHVMFTNIVNIRTMPLIMGTLGMEKKLHPRECHEYGTPDYQALIGSDLGRIVVGLVLSAFPRGTARISRVFISNVEDMAQMRLDIERTLTPAIRKSLADNGLSEEDLEMGSALTDLPEDLSEEGPVTIKQKGKQKVGGKSPAKGSKKTEAITGPNVKTRSMTRKEEKAAQKKS
ncbi:hypothetical protein N7540_005505 [Penicillium herquei]|nr:hypothetical protein N7540_005505 [Penicillium herquei]